MKKFSGNIRLECIPGTVLFKILNTVIFKSELVGDVEIPEDIETDLTTVPWYLRWLVSTTGKHKEAAILHDAMLKNPRYTRLQSDDVFVEGLEDLGISNLKQALMYAGVRINAILKGDE